MCYQVLCLWVIKCFQTMNCVNFGFRVVVTSTVQGFVVVQAEWPRRNSSEVSNGPGGRDVWRWWDGRTVPSEAKPSISTSWWCRQPSGLLRQWGIQRRGPATDVHIVRHKGLFESLCWFAFELVIPAVILRSNSRSSVSDFSNVWPQPTTSFPSSTKSSLSSLKLPGGGSRTSEEPDFFTKQARLQAEARLALAQVLHMNPFLSIYTLISDTMCLSQCLCIDVYVHLCLSIYVCVSISPSVLSSACVQMSVW